MDKNQDSISGLQEAIKYSPDNAPLRILLGEALCKSGKFAEAEKEYGLALSLSPGNMGARTGLAYCFYQLGKYMQSLVLVEDLIKGKEPSGRALVLHARLLLNDGNQQYAKSQYERALQLDNTVADPSLAERLGIGSESKISPSDDAANPNASPEKLAIGHSHYQDSQDFDIAELFADIVEKPSISFEDIGGMEEVKNQVNIKIIQPLKNPDMFKAYGKAAGGGILMYGPPGCGKTHLARACAGEIEATFISVGIHDILDMWIGNSEKNLHELFEQARRLKPCVLFFDEVDALAASRKDISHAGARQIVNQFLAELDGISGSNENLLILAATNAPWHLDTAFRRPGRFDRIIFVPPPDLVARAQIFRITLKNKPVENIDFEHLARKTEKYSGADIKAVVDVAIEKKLEQVLKTGEPAPISTRDLENAFKQVRPSTQEWFATAKNYALYSNQGGTYDDIIKYLKL